MGKWRNKESKGLLWLLFLCLEHGPSVCLSFNFGKANDNDNDNYTCELSNSERYLEPERLEQRSSYDYYGTATEVSFNWFFSVVGEFQIERKDLFLVSQFSGNNLNRLTGRNIWRNYIATCKCWQNLKETRKYNGTKTSNFNKQPKWDSK